MNELPRATAGPSSTNAGDVDWQASRHEGGSLNVIDIKRSLPGKCIASLEAASPANLTIHFGDGTTLDIKAVGGKLHLDVAEALDRTCPIAAWPTSRQNEYLEFITKYIDRFGRSPAESDIQRHFLVSAPSVNHMVQGLERRGFIVRQPGVPRSIRVAAPEQCAACGGTHHRKKA